jgi:hypothetical protein
MADRSIVRILKKLPDREKKTAGLLVKLLKMMRDR